MATRQNVKYDPLKPGICRRRVIDLEGQIVIYRPFYYEILHVTIKFLKDFLFIYFIYDTKDKVKKLEILIWIVANWNVLHEIKYKLILQTLFIERTNFLTISLSIIISFILFELRFYKL